MRIDLYFHDFKDRSESNRTLEILELFINQHLIMNTYSSVYSSVSFKFLNNPPKKREAKVLLPYGVHPEVEILSNFEDNRKLSVETFRLAFDLLKEAISRIPYAPSKTEFDFDVEGFLRDINRIDREAPQSKETLRHLDDSRMQLSIQNRMKHKLSIIQNFRENPRPLDTKIIGVRVLSSRYQFNDDEDIYFYQNMYAAIFSSVLRENDIRLPGYQEIYFNLVGSLEEATDISTSKDDWFQYTHALLDYTKFKQSPQETKEQLILESLFEGLRYITDFDHLEKDKIEGANKYIQKYRLDTPLIYAIKAENEEYEVKIQYKISREMIIRNFVKASYELHIFKKTTREWRVIPLGVFETFYISYILSKIHLTKKQVIIKGRTGLRADIHRSSEKAPSEFKFQLQELFKN